MNSGKKNLSAGILLFRRGSGGIEVLLAHPGGPFFARKDERSWSIPKGECEPGEDLLAAARREFREEIGVEAPGNPIPLGSVRQSGGKIVHAWAVEGDLPAGWTLCCNTFLLEWPPRSGRQQEFPEVDRAEFFPLETARVKINPSQAPLLDRLLESLPEAF